MKITRLDDLNGGKIIDVDAARNTLTIKALNGKTYALEAATSGAFDDGCYFEWGVLKITPIM